MCQGRRSALSSTSRRRPFPLSLLSLQTHVDATPAALRQVEALLAEREAAAAAKAAAKAALAAAPALKPSGGAGRSSFRSTAWEQKLSGRAQAEADWLDGASSSSSADENRVRRRVVAVMVAVAVAVGSMEATAARAFRV